MANCSKTEVFLAEWKRMCKYYRHCESCDANEGGCLCIKTPNNIINNIEKAQNIVQKWSDEHHEPQPKTYADDFFEKYPHAKRCENGRPLVPRCDVYGCECNYKKAPEVIYWQKKQGIDDCLACWNEPYEEVE